MTTIINGSSPSITFSDGSAQTSATRPFLNRLINGGMVIDQRFGGASGLNNSTSVEYVVDRWNIFGSVATKFSAQQNAGSVTPPAGFSNYLGITSLSAYTVGAAEFFYLQQVIEGFNTADLNWGTANAKTVTLSFQVYSSLTGTFGGSLQNSANNYSYPFNYTILSVNTWTQISITIAGPTAGTWIGATNGAGMRVYFGLGTGATYSGTAGSWSSNLFIQSTGSTSVVGTNGATFYITGVQLEVGSTATSFDYRPIGTELALCQRYFQTFIINSYSYAGNTFGTNDARTTIPLLVSMRTAPTGITIIGTVAFTTAGGSTNGAATFHNATISQISILSGASGYAAAGGSSSLTGGGTIQVSTEL